MAIREGQTYSCPDPNCAAEVVVTRGAKPGCPGTFIPRCCCGKDMLLQTARATGTDDR
jgi:hypothetical protein